MSLTTLEFDKTLAKTCGTWTPKAPDESGYNGIISSMDGESAAAPVWWVLVYKLSKGEKQAAVSSIPCRPDLRQLGFELQRTFIKNRALADELQDFTNDCYSLALYQWKRRDQGQTTDKAVLSDLSWIGSSTFLKGDYITLQSKLPRGMFSWSDARDSDRLLLPCTKSHGACSAHVQPQRFCYEYNISLPHVRVVKDCLTSR